MSPRLLAQLAWVFARDAAALEHEYEWPPVTPTKREAAEARRLLRISDKLMGQACDAGQLSGTDFCFGGEP